MNQKIQNHLSAKDKVLKEIIQQVPFPEVISTKNVFHDLMSCIIEQQIHYRSTKKTFQKMLEAAGIKELSLANFPILEKKGLQKVKLARPKYETIIRILDFFGKNEIDWASKEDQEVIQILSQIKGVGTWTIEMILLYTLERATVFPADDYHLKQLMGNLYPIDSAARVKAQMKSIAANWAPYQSAAVKYLLAWKSFQKKELG